MATWFPFKTFPQIQQIAPLILISLFQIFNREYLCQIYESVQPISSLVSRINEKLANPKRASSSKRRSTEKSMATHGFSDRKRKKRRRKCRDLYKRKAIPQAGAPLKLRQGFRYKIGDFQGATSQRVDTRISGMECHLEVKEGGDGSFPDEEAADGGTPRHPRCFNSDFTFKYLLINEQLHVCCHSRVQSRTWGQRLIVLANWSLFLNPFENVCLPLSYKFAGRTKSNAGLEMIRGDKYLLENANSFDMKFTIEQSVEPHPFEQLEQNHTMVEETTYGCVKLNPNLASSCGTQMGNGETPEQFEPESNLVKKATNKGAHKKVIEESPTKEIWPLRTETEVLQYEKSCAHIDYGWYGNLDFDRKWLELQLFSMKFLKRVPYWRALIYSYESPQKNCSDQLWMGRALRKARNVVKMLNTKISMNRCGLYTTNDKNNSTYMSINTTPWKKRVINLYDSVYTIDLGNWNLEYIYEKLAGRHILKCQLNGIEENSICQIKIVKLWNDAYYWSYYMTMEHGNDEFLSLNWYNQNYEYSCLSCCIKNKYKIRLTNSMLPRIDLFVDGESKNMENVIYVSTVLSWHLYRFYRTLDYIKACICCCISAEIHKIKHRFMLRKQLRSKSRSNEELGLDQMAAKRLRRRTQTTPHVHKSLRFEHVLSYVKNANCKYMQYLKRSTAQFTDTRKKLYKDCYKLNQDMVQLPIRVI